ncbi:MAG: ATP-grasp domain-containing protein [Chloroflexota bacterium]
MNTLRVILLMRASTCRAGAFVEAADRLGIGVVRGIDIDPKLAEQWPVRLPLQFDRPEESAQRIVDFARQQPVAAILAVDDSATVIAAMASERLGLLHNSGQAAQAARNKHHMRQLLAATGLLSPQFQLFDRTDDPRSIGSELDYPCVLKPLLLSGSRGVIRADNPVEFMAAFTRLGHILDRLAPTPDSTKILVEDFIPGFEVALEGILDQGRLHVLALFDKPDPLDGPFFEETIYVTPSRLPDAVQAEIAGCTAQAAAALGLQLGPVHAELRVNEAGPWIVEIAGRSIGGLCSQTLRFGPDISLEELILRQAVGLKIESLRRQGEARGVMMIPIPEAGLLMAVTGLAEAEAVPGIESIEITARLNQPLVPLPEGDSYLGFIFAAGRRPAEVEVALRQAHRRLKFEVLPLLSLA